MATGRGNKLVGQTGEYLVAAELSRMKLIATTFTGNVPEYDIIASDDKGKHVAVQVKASTGPSWQIADISKFCDIRFKGKKQIVGRAKSSSIRNLVCVFVKVDTNAGSRNDRFFVCTWEQWRNLLVDGHRAYLKKHHGCRPKKPESLHSAIQIEALVRFENNWQAIRENLH